MVRETENPVAVCQRPPGSVFVGADAPDEPMHIGRAIVSQPRIPEELNPVAMPILATHWFGVATDDQRTA